MKPSTEAFPWLLCVALEPSDRAVETASKMRSEQEVREVIEGLGTGSETCLGLKPLALFTSGKFLSLSLLSFLICKMEYPKIGP